MPKKYVLEGDIGWGIEAYAVKQILKEANGEDIIIDWSSPGGSVFQGITIYNLFKNYSGNVQFHIIGLAASMGSYIPLSGNGLPTIEPNATFMIHNARSFVAGDHNDMRKQAKIIEGLSNILAKEYIEKTGKSEREIKKMMDEETFLFGAEIKEAGFAKEIIGIADDDPNAKNAKIALAKESYEACFSKLKNEKPDDYEQAAALLEKYNGKTVDLNPAKAEKNKKEIPMDLETIRKENPAIDAQVQLLLQDAKSAGFEEGKAQKDKIIKKASIAFDPEKSYPAAIQTLAKSVLEGEEEVAALTGAMTVYDAQQEELNSKAAVEETAKTSETPGEETPKISQDGAVNNEADYKAEIDRMKGEM